MVRNFDQTYYANKHLHEQSNNNTTSIAVEELRLQQQCFHDQGDRPAEDALQVRIEDAQEPLRQQEALVAAPAAAVASGSRCTPRADPSDLFDACGRAWCRSRLLVKLLKCNH